ncbi:MAG TPA: PEGA domain-containing protein, partial [Armatimonadota bacterium]
DKAYPAFAEAMLTVATRKSIPVTVTVAFSAPEKPNLSQSATGQVLLLGTTEFSFADSEAKLSARWKDQFINAPFLSLFLTPTDRSVVAFADLAVQLMNAPGAPANAAGLDARRYCQALYELLRANNVTCNETSEFLVNPDASGNVQYPRQTLGTHKGTSLDLSLLFASACLAKGLPAHVLVKLGQALVVVSLPDATVFAIDLSVLGDSKRGRDGFAGAVKSGNAANKITLENGESLCYAITVDKQLSIPPPNPDEKPPINLGRLQGAITVKSTPIGAKVFLDGVERGVTSVDGLTLSNLPVGNYAVTLRQNGYREESQQVQVNYMTARDVLFTLQELPKPTLTVDLRCKTPLLAAGYKVYGAPAFGDGGYWAACATVKNTGVIPLANLKLTYTFGAYGSWTSPRQYATLAPGAEITDKAYPAFAEAMLTVATRKSIPVTVTVAFSAPEKPNLSQRVTGQALLLGTTEFSFTDSEGKLSTRWKDQFSNAPFLSLFLTPTDRPVVEFADLAVQLMNATGTPANAAGLDVRRYCQALYELLYANNVTCEEPRGFLMKPEATDNVQYPRQTLETHKGTSLDLSMLFASVCLAKGIPAQVVIMRGEALAAISLPDTTVFAIDLSGLGTSKVRDGFTVAVKTGTAIRMINLKSGASLSYTIACDKPLEVKLLSAVLAPLRNGILGEWHYQLPRAQAPPAAGKSTPVIFY